MKYSAGVSKFTSQENKVSGNFTQLARVLVGKTDDTEARDDNESEFRFIKSTSHKQHVISKPMELRNLSAQGQRKEMKCPR